MVEPEGEFPDEFDGSVLMNALAIAQPFIGTDASRPWGTGALLDGSSIFATNNVVIVEVYTGVPFPFRCNLPGATVKELLRIGEKPIAVQGSRTSLTFHYESGGWLKTQLYSSEWPDVRRIVGAECDLETIDDRIFDALETLRPFVDPTYGRVLLTEQGISTEDGEQEGAHVDIKDFTVRGVYNLGMLQLLSEIATEVDFSKYPQPCLFQGDHLRGAIIGMREGYR